ncbi:hypothetical protein BEWA_001600 [Theileria equi strain WA]|uniref:Uncharacterized protein n=1 Tax=Theileria equi strain WA TaxID=1537102 RepID=L0AZR8_THEEQ|nr:hypothetical protein BEWA_001600 [Theileria equi strain WA]AFZ80753.1 hypothetical protein BEWA_001600 [Theileria equi strain WA]|eukprot:XP_004830419.1 hypothetical protein BEWA_001600 [Theileria equi strain WA]
MMRSQWIYHMMHPLIELEGRNTYCCRCHDKGASGIDKRKVSVTKGKIQAGSKPLDYYKHDISGRNSRLAGIKYYPKGYDANTPSQRRRIKLGDKAFPLSNTQAVYAFHCGGNPVLIYVSSSQEDVKGWYKPNTTGDNVTWQRVSGISKDPDNIKDCNGSDFDALVEELVSAGCRIYSTCKELQSQSPQKRGASPSGPSGPPSSRLTASPDEVGEKDVAAVYAKAETGASGAEQEQQDSVARSENFGGTDQDGEGEKAFYSSDGRPTEALPALQSATTDDQTASPGTPEAPPQPFAAAPVATSLWLTFGSTSATLAGAGGLTGLGWWAFKRSKGDPWVRQI